MTQSDSAFTAFLAASSRDRMSPVEQTMYDFFAVGKDPAVEKQIRRYKIRKAS